MGDAFLSEDERRVIEGAHMAPDYNGRIDPELVADWMEAPQLDSRSVRSTMSTLAQIGWFRRARGAFELDGGAVQG